MNASRLPFPFRANSVGQTLPHLASRPQEPGVLQSQDTSTTSLYLSQRDQLGPPSEQQVIYRSPPTGYSLQDEYRHSRDGRLASVASPTTSFSPNSADDRLTYQHPTSPNILEVFQAPTEVSPRATMIETLTERSALRPRLRRESIDSGPSLISILRLAQAVPPPSASAASAMPKLKLLPFSATIIVDKKAEYNSRSGDAKVAPEALPGSRSLAKSKLSRGVVDPTIHRQATPILLNSSPDPLSGPSAHLDTTFPSSRRRSESYPNTLQHISSNTRPFESIAHAGSSSQVIKDSRHAHSSVRTSSHPVQVLSSPRSDYSVRSLLAPSVSSESQHKYPTPPQYMDFSTTTQALTHIQRQPDVMLEQQMAIQHQDKKHPASLFPISAERPWALPAMSSSKAAGIASSTAAALLQAEGSMERDTAQSISRHLARPAGTMQLKPPDESVQMRQCADILVGFYHSAQSRDTAGSLGASLVGDTSSFVNAANFSPMPAAIGGSGKKRKSSPLASNTDEEEADAFELGTAHPYGIVPSSESLPRQIAGDENDKWHPQFPHANKTQRRSSM